MKNIDSGLVKRGIKQLVVFNGLIGFLSVCAINNIGQTVNSKVYLTLFLCFLCLLPASFHIYRVGKALARMSWVNKLMHISFILLGSILMIFGLAFGIVLLTGAGAEEVLTITLVSLLFLPYFVAILATGSMAIMPGDSEYAAFDAQSPYSNRLETPIDHQVKAGYRCVYAVEYYFSYGWWLDNLMRLYRRRRLAVSPLVRLYALFPPMIFTYFTNEINHYCQENKLSQHIPDNYFWRNLKRFKYLFIVADLALPIMVLLPLIYPNIYLGYETCAFAVIGFILGIYANIMGELVEVTRNINRATFSENRMNENKNNDYIHIG